MSHAAAAIYGRLSSVDAVTALVVDRIFPHVVPETVTAFPAIAYAIDLEEDDADYDGVYGLTMAEGSIGVLAETYKQALDVAAAVKTALHALGGTWGTFTVLSCHVEGQADDVERDPARKKTIYVRSLRFLIWVR